VTGWWTIDDRAPEAPECFVIPSYALVDRTTPTLPTRAEIELAVRWWRRFPDSRLILCTGDNQRLGVTNAEVMADYAASLGVPRDRLVEEDRSRNTWENLSNALEIVRRLDLRQPTLVTHDLYTRRAVATARRLSYPDLHWLSARSAGEPAHGWKRFQTRSRATILVYELLAMLYSRLARWV